MKKTDLFVFSEILYFSAAGGEIVLIGTVFFCFREEFVCSVRVWPAQLRRYSLYGRSAVIGCNAVEDAEQRLERPCRLVYQLTKGCVLI